MPDAIRTNYRGVSFRSRLEAKWARMFDLIGWKWEYEPIDLPGWIPDFALLGSGGRSVLVEVKPILSFSEVTRGLIGKWEGALRGAERSSDVLLLGALGPAESESSGGYSIGWLGSQEPLDGLWFEDALLSRDDAGWDFYHSHGSWHHRLHGTYDGNGHLRAPDLAEVAQFDAWWAEATNSSQWERSA